MSKNKDNLSLIEKVLKKPHLIVSILAIFIFAGILGYGKIHRNLFPNSNYPEVRWLWLSGG